MKILIDTCIVIDALQNREPFAKEARDIFIMTANEQVESYVTAKSVTDIYYLLHRSTHSDLISREQLSKLLQIFHPLDTCGSDCINAIPSLITDFEDAVMVETAKREGIDYIVTRNTRDYSKSAINCVCFCNS